MNGVSAAAASRSTWRAVALPSEHGGWGLTLEPALLGLLVAPSLAGAAIGAVAFLAFLARTPVKLVLVDHHRGRRLDRTLVARRFAAAELAALAALVAVAVASAGAEWLIPIAAATPFFAVELWFDARSRSRRLVPELCGAIGISGFVAAIVMADGGSASLAIALWCVLAARAIASVTFARVQVLRLHHGTSSTTTSDLAQLAGVAVAMVAWLVDTGVVVGAICVLAVTTAQFAWSRGPARQAKVVGIWQMVFGLVVVAGTAIGVLV